MSQGDTCLGTERWKAQKRLLQMVGEGVFAYKLGDDPIRRYLSVVMTTIHAEVCAIRHGDPHVLCISEHNCKYLKHRVSLPFNDSLEGVPGSLCVFREQPCIAALNRERTRLTLHVRAELKTDEENKKHNLLVYGLVSPLIQDLAAVYYFLIKKLFPPILHAIATPTLRGEVKMPPLPDGFDSCRLNAKQRAAVAGLRYEVEGIQGPPGTGKSTAIECIVQARVPLEEMAVVTCIQNEAVEAVVQKLARANIPFFVTGAEDRLGPESLYWTIEAQVCRDEEFARFERRCRFVQQVAKVYERDGIKEEFKVLSRWYHIGWRLKWIPCMKGVQERYTWKKLDNLKLRKQQEVVKNARVALCTMDSTPKLLGLKLKPIFTVLVDEAGTVT